VRQRDVNADAQLSRAVGGGAREPHRRAAAAGNDLDLAWAQRDAERLAYRLLGAKTRREVASGTCARRRVGALGVREEALGEPRPARERALEPFDLEQVDANHAAKLASRPVAETRVLSDRELNRALLARQLLLERAAGPIPRVLERIGGIQAQ
jgi:hypothetical protein